MTKSQCLLWRSQNDVHMGNINLLKCGVDHACTAQSGCQPKSAAEDRHVILLILTVNQTHTMPQSTVTSACTLTLIAQHRHGNWY